MAGMTMGFELPLPSQQSATSHIYLEVAAAVTVNILAGRYLEARVKSCSGAALRALLGMGPKTWRSCAKGGGAPISDLAWVTCSWSAQGEDRHRRCG